jgi:ectoine hydroxylase-related dioxygenase (phytanoyl-CoA dioxygenase family)
MPASLNDFIASLESDNTAQEYSFTGRIEHQIPVYDGHRLRNLDDEQMRAVQREWAECWLHGVGIIAISDFYAEADSVDAMTRVLLRLIEREQRDKNAIGDHFAGQGANKRLWNALEKVSVEDPQVFIDYYQNPLLGVVAEAWLGPGYQVTAQVNLVPPGSSAQAPHRDYHLGFQTDTEVERYPQHVQTMSAFLSLQGAVAHADMPVESGPTRVLPHSQRYELGYQLYRQEDFKTFFEQHAVQLPMALGDAAFFNPALMHGAGANNSEAIQRIANLLQISSPFGIPMETVGHDRIQLACYDALKASTLQVGALETLSTVISDGYPFPTNLDRDVPDSSLTPTSSKQLLLRALDQGWDKAQFEQALEDYRWRRCSA